MCDDGQIVLLVAAFVAGMITMLLIGVLIEAARR